MVIQMSVELQDFVTACTDPYLVIFCVFISGFFIGQMFTFIGAVVEEIYYMILNRKRKRHENKVIGDQNG